MTRMDQDYAPVLSGVDRLVGEMAKNVLAEAGIPSLLHGPDFDLAELGSLAHSRLRGLQVLVPRSAEALAKQVLEEAFGGDVPDGELEDDTTDGAELEVDEDRR